MTTQTATPQRVPIHALVPTETRTALEQMARTHDRSIAAEVRRALDAHIRNHDTRTENP